MRQWGASVAGGGGLGPSNAGSVYIDENLGSPAIPKDTWVPIRLWPVAPGEQFFMSVYVTGETTFSSGRRERTGHIVAAGGRDGVANLRFGSVTDSGGSSGALRFRMRAIGNDIALQGRISIDSADGQVRYHVRYMFIPKGAA